MLPSFEAYSRDCRARRARRSQLLINLVKLLEANRYLAPPQGYDREMLASLLGVSINALRQILAKSVPTRVWLDGWLKEIRWQAVRKNRKEWFVRI